MGSLQNVSVQAPIVVELPGARAVFTTRAGGVSTGPYASLNLGFLTDDDPDSVRRNRVLLQEAYRVGLAYGLQVHGNCIRVVDQANRDDALPAESDGIATATPGVAPMVLAADCLPIAIAGGGAVAMVHAGWQGLATDVIAAGVQTVRELSRSGSPLVAAIGPGAGVCCYEVSEELHLRFAGRGEPLRQGRNLDLKAIARRQLSAAGVDEVQDVECCTICGGDQVFFSHRRERGLTGRQAGLVWLT